MKKIRIGINGLGRIGRACLKVAFGREDLEVIAVNDLGELENLAYLLKYDTAYGKSGLDVSVAGGKLVVNGKTIEVFQEKDPAQIPWGKHEIDVVIESTGVFDSYAKSKAHLDAGARKVVISAPVKDEPVPGITTATVLMGINDSVLESCQISSNASCTTNASSPLMQILHEAIGIEKAILNTIHAYTATQRLVDSPDAKDWRRGRAGAQNVVPSTTGAAIAVTQAIPDLKGKFDGLAVRVPVVTGSLVDITFLAKRPTSAEEINGILKKATAEDRWNKVFAVTEEQLVSSDIIGCPHASLADLSFTKVVDGNLVKVMAWYDNEMGYTHALMEHVAKTGAEL